MSDETGRILLTLERLEAGQHSLGDRLGHVENRLGQLDGQLGHLDGRLGHLDDRLGHLDGRLGHLEQGVDRLRIDLMARMDRLQDGLASVRNDVIVNYGNTERVERSVRSGEEQTRLLADQVNLMFKRILGIDERVRALEEKP
jgi:predicted nuclease with TOPRIM domain